MIARPDPDALLAGPLGGWLAEQAGLRESTRARAQRRFYWAVGAAALVAFVTIVRGGAVPLALELGALVGAGGFGWMAWTRRPVEVKIKAGINTAIARALALDYSTVVTDPQPFARACAFDLLPRHDKAATEDQWSGELAGQRFCLHEARLTEERGSGKNRRTVTVFAGVVMAVSFARRFSGVTLIRRKSRSFGLVKALLGGQDRLTVNGQALQRVDLVDPRFEDSFEVWASDQVEAHYLINPAYAERLVAIEQAFRGDKIRTVFAAGELLIALESKNLFESGSIDASDDRARLEQTIAQFGALADLAVQLNERPR